MYEIYKPFRNHMRKYSLSSGLLAVYSYMQFLQFDERLPRELSHPLLQWRDPMQMGLHPWELLTIARELLLNCEMRGESLYSWSEVANSCNRLKGLENSVWAKLSADGDISFELARIANRQFDWQLGFNQPTVSRYYRIINHDLVRPAIVDEFDMSPAELYQIGMALAGHFLKSPIITIPITNEINGVSEASLNRFSSRFSKTLDEHRALTRGLQSYDINWAYNISSLEEFPLIRFSDHFMCPVPTLFLRRLTSGLYFDLVRRGDEFVNTFGLSYEAYVGEVLRASNRDGSFGVFPAERYGTKRAPKDSIDWIISDEGASLFIECKASRVKLKAKIDLNEIGSISDELARMARFLAQAYATLSHAVDGQYNSWKPNGLPVYPVVVTLDNWQRLRLVINDVLSVHLHAEFDRRGLDRALIDRYPYTVCSVDEFEQAVQIMKLVGIDRFMALKVDADHFRWDVTAFITNHFSAESRAVRRLFDWDFAAGIGQ